ncbi:nucleotide exchange factor GrpE [Candidatus Gracilibacteria bacterium]|nr:nucleotide exchange factor GrpE [Candidatus Gracilibacteria bacterium]MCF7898413.1 nucleotide exchange factor GrpE [Candidatus Paceibacterota bacterium]
MNKDEEIINDDITQEEQVNPNEELTTPNDNEDDISFEDIDEDGEQSIKLTVKKLREKIKKLEAEKQEYLDLSQRTRADYVNFKKEVENNQASNRKFATKRFIEELLPVLDSYDMAQGNTESWEKVDKNWRVGIEYIFNQFRTVLEGEGVTQFGKVGDTFNPELHETMESVNVEKESDDEKIVKVLQNGYKMNDSILRPARVHVGQYKNEN